MKKTYIITRRQGIYVMPAESIVYLENSRRKVIVHTSDMDYEFYGKLSDVAKVLDARFLHCHRSYLINMDYVCSMNGYRIEFADGRVIPLGRNVYFRTVKKVKDYLETEKDGGWLNLR